MNRLTQVTCNGTRTNQYITLGIFVVSLAILLPFYVKRDFYGLEVSFVQQVLELQISQRFSESDSALYVYFLSALISYAISYPLAVLALLCIIATGFKSRSSSEWGEFGMYTN